MVVAEELSFDIKNNSVARIGTQASKVKFQNRTRLAETILDVIQRAGTGGEIRLEFQEKSISVALFAKFSSSVVRCNELSPG